MQTRKTSKKAKKSVAPHLNALQTRVLRFIKAGKRYGATCDEAEEGLRMRHQTASARVYELRLMNLIVDSGTRRRTRSGRTAIVWVEPRWKP